jgi:hypothetical protein
MRTVTTIPLDPRNFPGLPEGSNIVVAESPLTGRKQAQIASIGAVIDLDARDDREAMAELVDKLKALMAARAKTPLRDGRHDRGWTKVAA